MVESMQVDKSANSDLQADVVDQRVEQKGKFGTVRFLGKLINNPKAGDDLWLGIEWDDEGSGRNNGTVDGIKYFDCQFHKNSPNSCSFIRYGKIQIGGVSLREAIMKKYKPESMMSEQEKEEARRKEEAELYVNTGTKGMKKIEIVGVEQSYQWRADVTQSRDITLEHQKISSCDATAMKELIPGTMNLYLDKNLLWNWDQVFLISKQLAYLRLLTLTGNKLKRLEPDYLKDKDVNQMINLFLNELVLIDMALDWSQIDILAPALIYVENLHLVRNQCSVICSKYTIPAKDHFKNIKFINLEANGIESWDEIIEFRQLSGLKRLTLSKNRIKNIYYKPGFKELYMLTIEDNLIDNWKSFDAISEFPQVRNLRAAGNPILLNEKGEPSDDGRINAIARCQFVTKYNGSVIDNTRKDYEISYMKNAFKEFVKTILNGSIEAIQTIEDEIVAQYMTQHHPRFYELVEKFGNPMQLVNVIEQKSNIASTTAKLTLISECSATQGKQLNKKLLLTMNIATLKAMCSKLFKVEVIHQKLVYIEDGFDEEYLLDEDYRQLQFYSCVDGGKIIVREI